jgi:hypothetical protein
MAKKQNKSIWGELRFPNEFVNTFEGRMPLELFMNKHKVTTKVQYDQTEEVLIKTAPPKFVLETTSVDFGLIFDNGFKIRGVSKKFWNEIIAPISIEKVRPPAKMPPKLKEEPKRKKNERSNKE